MLVSGIFAASRQRGTILDSPMQKSHQNLFNCVGWRQSLFNMSDKGSDSPLPGMAFPCPPTLFGSWS